MRKPRSVQRSLAYLITAFILYFPANFLPIMYTSQLGRSSPSTIIGGVITLWVHGSYVIAAIIFIASVFVPSAKMLVIAHLLFTANAKENPSPKQNASLLHMTEVIGRWSMIDVFVVAVLVAMIQLGKVMYIQPGPAALAFAGVVIATMLSAMSFDPRLIWDSANSKKQQTAEKRSAEPYQVKS
ncbi:MAG: paraquat-inducible protein A [Verrucomicrobiota bacterium]